MAELKDYTSHELVCGAELLARSILTRVCAAMQDASPLGLNGDTLLPVMLSYAETTALVNILTAARVTLSERPAGATLQ